MEDSNCNPNTFPHSQNSHSSNNATADVSLQVPDSGGSSGGGAKYKLMSPAKLPISRSTTCITIPPGLSPTSFLESPVLLSNIKAEPSPTTGSFFMAQFMQGKTAAMSPEKNYSSSNDVDENASSCFEFKFHTGSSTAAGSSSLTVPAGLTKNGLVSQDDRFLHSPAASALVSHEQPSIEELRLSASTGMHELPVCSPGDEQNQGGHSNIGIQLSSSDQKDSISTIAADKTSDDGYNWRKYGQKLVKGSEFPRSYYKCTYLNCEVKKIFERSPGGHITEIMYKGSHDHPKPQAARRNNLGAPISIQEEKVDNDFSFTGQEDKLNTKGSELDVSLALSPRQANMETLDVSRTQIQGTNDDIDEDDPFSKRRKMEDGLDVTPIIKPIREPRVVVQTVSEVDILDDGYRWRKYGQKVVRGNANPRSYYKCTSAGCPVRKHVERASHDPKAVITTYEGKHNHDLPTAKTSSHEFAERVQYGKMNRLEENSSVSLDLGVGMSCVSDNKTTNEQQAHAFNAEAMRSQIPPSSSSMMIVQASQIPTWSSFVNGRLNMYGSRENHVEGRSSLQTPPIHPSNQCPGNLGRILMEH